MDSKLQNVEFFNETVSVKCVHFTEYRARLLPFDAIRREQKINMSFFRRSLVVVSQSSRNFDHFRRSRMRHGIVVS